jgi:preprotein translocase subunit SecD
VRRYARTLILIAVLIAVAAYVLVDQQISIGNFERGEDTLLGLSLGLDLQGGSHLVYRAIDAETGEPMTPSDDQMEGLRRTIETRVNASGLGEPVIQILGGDRLLIQLPGVDDPERAKGLIGETATLVFKHRILDVERFVDEITDEDIIRVWAGTLTAEGQIAGTHTTTATTTEPVGATTTESQPGEGEEAAAQDGLPPVMLIEFTEEGAEAFDALGIRLLESLLQASVTGGQDNPSRLNMTVNGVETLRFELSALSITRIGTTTTFGMGLPVDVGGIDVTDVETAQALLGENPTISMVEIQGQVDEEISEGALTGEDLARAYASTHSASGQPIVNIEFNSRGTRIFGELTQKIYEKEQLTGARDQVAIFLDDEELISPQVETPITSGLAIIQGRDFTLERVRDISLLLESGRLPVPIELIQERDVDAILGADSLKKSVIAGLIGLAIVLLFMLLYYRVPGVVASLALMIYAAVVLAIFKMLPITMTLSGVAAVILSIGMAVDANILIFERMKDELRAGRTLMSAINIGFNRAWPAIRDGNFSTLITCAILFWFSDQLGATVVQGFAVALAIGVLVSMFSAITVSRTFLRVLATTPLSRRLGLFVPSGGADLPQHRQAASSAQRS